MDHRFGRSVAVLMAVGLLTAGFPVASQAAWSTVAFLGDGDCGVSSAYTYTCAVDLNGLYGSDRTVNGVHFERVGPTTEIDPYVPYAPSGANWSATGFLSQGRATTCNTTGDIREVVRDFYIGAGGADPITITLAGLTPGTQYLFTAYNLAGNLARNITVTTTLGDYFAFNETWTGNGNANLVDYWYTAPAGGSVTLTFGGGTDGTNSFRAHAFSNRLKPALGGDTNLDGTVNINDLSKVLTNYDKTGMLWADGDFDGNGTVNISDLSKVLTNYDKTFVAAGDGITTVPEPGTLSLLATALGVCLGLVRRKRNR
jgi:hypothetical protein